MANDKVEILGIRVTDRKKEAGKVQQALTDYGCSIKTRLGLHETSDDFCSSQGIILLEVFGKQEDIDKLKHALDKIEGIALGNMLL